MKVEMLENPTDKDWIEVKRRALVTIGLNKIKTEPNEEWKKKMLKALHSPIRYLRFSFYMEVPYWVSVHYCRHVHAQPYVRSQRNDRQNEYDRNSARQDEIVSMIFDMNAEEFITIAQKRLCNMASPETRAVVQEMVNLVIRSNPEFKEVLVPRCEYIHGCNEFNPCGKYKAK